MAKPTLIIKNSLSQIIGFSASNFDLIKQVLSYVDEDIQAQRNRLFKQMAYAKKSGKNKYYFAMKARLEALPPASVCWLGTNGLFPTGLLNKVQNVIKDIQHVVEDKRVKPDAEMTLRWKNKVFDLRPYQQEMVDLAQQNERGVFEAAVGSGKSLIITYLIKQKAMPTLIVVPSLALLEQLSRTLEHAFGKENVQIVNSEKVRTSKKLKPIRIANIQSISALQKSEELGLLIDDIGMLIIDEIHHAGAKSYTDLLMDIEHVYYRYGFTGTFLRNDSKTMDMHGFLSNVLYDYPPKRATEEGYITPAKYHIVQVPGNGNINYQKEYNLNYCSNMLLLEKIAEIVKPIEEQVLILVERKEKSGKLIHEYLKKQGIMNTYISGDDSKEDINDAIEAFNAGEINVLIGSSVIGEGVDVYSTNHLILATGGKSETKFIQACGRAVRKNKGKEIAHIYDFQFENTMYLEKHFYERTKMFTSHFDGEVVIYGTNRAPGKSNKT